LAPVIAFYELGNTHSVADYEAVLGILNNRLKENGNKSYLEILRYWNSKDTSKLKGCPNTIKKNRGLWTQYLCLKEKSQDLYSENYLIAYNNVLTGNPQTALGKLVKTNKITHFCHLDSYPQSQDWQRLKYRKYIRQNEMGNASRFWLARM